MDSIVSKESLLQRILQTLAVAAMVVLQVFSFLIIPLFIIYMVFYTRFWWTCILYIAWYLTFDSDASTTGRRRSEWVRSWCLWSYAKAYYPINVVKAHPEELDPKRNYLFCHFPHGVLGVSTLLSIATNATNLQGLFPLHKTYLHSLKYFYYLPFLREIGIRLGGLEANRKALEYILGNKEGGNISGLVVGGAREVYYAGSGMQKIFLKERKGFVKVALKTGAPLVPVYCFGENELFTQINIDGGSIFQKIRDLIRRTIGIPVIFPIGRKDWLGMIPKRLPLTIIVGGPIDVQRTENPTEEQIDNLHRVFEGKLVELFEKHKKYYLEDYENAHLDVL